jgi:hypothetical protein
MMPENRREEATLAGRTHFFLAPYGSTVGLMQVAAAGELAKKAGIRPE